MPKFIVYETTVTGKDRRLAVCDSLSDAMKEQKRQRKLVDPLSAVGIQDKSQYDFIQQHNKKMKK